MPDKETLYAIALTRISGFNFRDALAIYRTLGSATAVYEHRNDIADIMPGCTPRLAKAIRDWDEPLKRAEKEMEFIGRHGITALTAADNDYPQRLKECVDAPLMLYYKGSAGLNAGKIVSVIGTRHCTVYGQDLIRKFVQRMKELCPEVLIVSGLAYGVDINAHRGALDCGLDTVGVLAHGLDNIYPSGHRGTAIEMVRQGGLLTEFMSETNADKVNFVRRNRIVAGIADATILVESALKGGGLITASIARSYNRDVFAFPGPVGAVYSEGCNCLIRDNGAQLITGADDMVKAMGWEDDALLTTAKAAGIERQLFPELDSEEQRVVDVLRRTNDLQLNIISVKADMPVNKVSAVLLKLEMKGVVKPFAGGVIHLIS
ncbi:MAG: DNA-processing protein DprA [Prevotella sp.]